MNSAARTFSTTTSTITCRFCGTPRTETCVERTPVGYCCEPCYEVMGTVDEDDS